MNSDSRKQEAQEARWVLRAQLGDRVALDCLLACVQDRLYRFLRHRLGSASDAEDCAQAVLIQVSRKLVGLREPRAFRPWMFRIAARQASKLGAGRRREMELLDEDAARIPAAEPEPNELEDLIPLLHREMERLPANSSQVLLLHYMEGLSLLETSKVLNKPLGTIKSRLAYGLAKLRAQLPRTGEKL
ncbi:MAG: RNA polymerase sigma factor [Planctomycetota bacterium]|nr:RNA polymerase sigma factor [Planctomycetota bacterium]